VKRYAGPHAGCTRPKARCALAPRKRRAPTRHAYEDEIGLIRGLHATIFDVGVRKWIDGVWVPKDSGCLIEQQCV